MRKRRFNKALRPTGVGLSLLPAAGRARLSLLAAACAVFTLLPAWTGVCYAREPLEVPLHRIDRTHRNDVRSILERRTLVRRLPTRTFRADSTTYVYLIDNLPLSSRLSGLLGFGNYRVEEMEDGRIHGRDSRGTEGDFWLVYSAPGSRIYWGAGSYDSWFIPKISAKILLVVEYRRVAAADPESKPGVMATKVDIYVSTSRLVAYLMDVLGTVTDKKLSRLITSARRTSEELSRNPLRVWNRMIYSNRFTPEELESFRRTLIPATSSGGTTTPQ